MSIQRDIWLKNAGILTEEEKLEELISEETLSLMEDNPFDTFSDITLYEMVESGLIDYLEEVMSKQAYVSAVKSAMDPDSEKNSHPDKIIARARKHHGDKFAKDLEKGASQWHFPKTYGKDKKMVPAGYDKLKDRKVANVTKSGKADKRHIQGLKTSIKTGY
jgi:hypothetical protein